MLRVWLARVVALFRRSQGGDLDEEIRTHLRMAIDENRRRGMSPEDALRAARLSFGSVDGTIEACRDQRGVPVIETILQDLRFALRSLRNRPGFSLTVVVTLGLGIGATALMFSVVKAVLIEPLLYRTPTPSTGHLLLSRSARRGREMSLRVSLGTTRGRLVRQLLVETLLLTGLAGLAGVALSGLAVRLVTMHLGTAPYWIDYTMDGRVLGLVVATCLATGLACGLVPALQVSKTDVTDRLKDGGRAGKDLGSVGTHRWTTGLLTAEVALTLILLARGRPDGAELSRAPWRDQRRRRGRLTTMGIRLSPARYPTIEERRLFYGESRTGWPP